MSKRIWTTAESGTAVEGAGERELQPLVRSLTGEDVGTRIPRSGFEGGGEGGEGRG